MMIPHHDHPRRSSGRHIARPRGFRRLPVLAVVGVVVALLLGAGVASASWLSSGDGTATAQGGEALAPTTTSVAGSAITTGLLYPGGSGTVKITVNNPNPYPVTVTTVAGRGDPTASGVVGCTTTGVTLATASPGASIPAKGSTTLTLTDAASMSSASDNGCQNATFTIPVTVTVTSA